MSPIYPPQLPVPKRHFEFGYLARYRFARDAGNGRICSTWLAFWTWRHYRAVRYDPVAFDCLSKTGIGLRAALPWEGSVADRSRGVLIDERDQAAYRETWRRLDEQTYGIAADARAAKREGE